jgi:hypothetical protein
MSKIPRTTSIVVLAAAVTVVAMLIATRSAAAQAGAGTVVCTDQTSVSHDAAQKWMQQQLQSGRTRFVTIERGTCAY